MGRNQLRLHKDGFFGIKASASYIFGSLASASWFSKTSDSWFTKAMVGWSLAWWIDRPSQKRADRKKKLGFYIFFIFPTDSTISLDLLDSQKSFTYQNLHNFARKTVLKFLKLHLKWKSIHTLGNKKITLYVLHVLNHLKWETFFFFFFFFADRPTDSTFQGNEKKIGQSIFFYFKFTGRPTDSPKMARHKHPLLVLKWLNLCSKPIFVNLFDNILPTGSESEHKASVQPGNRAAVHEMPSSREIQEASVCALLFPFNTPGEKEVPNAWMEHSLRLQWLRFWGGCED